MLGVGAGWAPSVSHACGWGRSGEVRLSAGLGAAFQALHLWTGKPPKTVYSWPFPPKLGVTNAPCCQQWPQGSDIGAVPKCSHTTYCWQGPYDKDHNPVRYWSPSWLCQRRGNKHLCAPEHKQLLLSWFSWAQWVYLHRWRTTFGVGGAVREIMWKQSSNPNLEPKAVTVSIWGQCTCESINNRNP